MENQWSEGVKEGREKDIRISYGSNICMSIRQQLCSLKAV